MPVKLRQLMIDRVDLVDKGANPDAHIVLFKRDAGKPPVSKGSGQTPDEIMARDEAMEQWHRVFSAFMRSVDSIMLADGDDDRTPMLREAVDQFAAKAKEALSRLGDMEKRALEQVDELVSIAKAGRKISGDRMRRLREVMRQLESILNEGDSGMAKNQSDKTLEEQLDELTKRTEALEAEKGELEKRNQELESQIAKSKEPDDPVAKRKAALAKMDPDTRAMFEEMEAVQKRQAETLAKAEEVAKLERDTRRKQDAIAKARGYKSLPVNPDDHYRIFMKLDANEALDDGERDALYGLLKDVRDELGCAILLISHDLHLVMAATDEVICLQRHVCCSGNPETVSRDPAYHELFGPAAGTPNLALYTHDHDHDHDLHGNAHHHDHEGPCNHD